MVIPSTVLSGRLIHPDEAGAAFAASHVVVNVSDACTWLVAVNRLVRTHTRTARSGQSFGSTGSDPTCVRVRYANAEDNATFGPVSSGGESAPHGSRQRVPSRSIAHRLTSSLRASATIAM